MDRTGASFDRCVEMIIDRLGAYPLLLQIPIGLESDFIGLVDLVENRAVIWHNEELGAKFDYQEIPDSLKAKAEKLRSALIEKVVELDDDLMSDYLDGKEISVADIKKCIRKGTVSSIFVPVLCGSAFKNKGVQPLLDAVVDYLPSPRDLKDIEGTDMEDKDKIIIKKNDSEDTFVGLAFKIMNDPFVGNLTFCRIYSGKLESGSSVLNSVKDNNGFMPKFLCGSGFPKVSIRIRIQE